MTIDKPGLYLDFDPNDYHADPCPEPSFHQSMVKDLLDQSPLHAWYKHPRLNPDFRADTDSKFDLGTVAHAMLIGRGKQVVVVDAADWRTKAAQNARDEAFEHGKTPVLASQYARAENMVKAARAQLELYDGLGDLFFRGDGEVVTAWQEEGIWCRQMIDWRMLAEIPIIADYKTTALPIGGWRLGAIMVNAGWHVQAGMAERGLLQVTSFERFRYLFIVQETTVPYALQVVEPSESAMMIGRKRLDLAIRLFAHCMHTGVWPSFPRQIVSPEFPGWAESAWLEREQNEFAEGVRGDIKDILMAG